MDESTIALKTFAEIDFFHQLAELLNALLNGARFKIFSGETGTTSRSVRRRGDRIILRARNCQLSGL